MTYNYQISLLRVPAIIPTIVYALANLKEVYNLSGELTIYYKRCLVMWVKD
jgi:hypothetical protein